MSESSMYREYLKMTSSSSSMRSQASAPDCSSVKSGKCRVASCSGNSKAESVDYEERYRAKIHDLESRHHISKSQYDFTECLKKEGWSDVKIANVLRWKKRIEKAKRSGKAFKLKLNSDDDEEDESDGSDSSDDVVERFMDQVSDLRVKVADEQDELLRSLSSNLSIEIPKEVEPRASSSNDKLEDVDLFGLSMKEKAAMHLLDIKSEQRFRDFTSAHFTLEEAKQLRKKSEIIVGRQIQELEDQKLFELFPVKDKYAELKRSLLDTKDPYKLPETSSVATSSVDACAFSSISSDSDAFSDNLSEVPLDYTSTEDNHLKMLYEAKRRRQARCESFERWLNWFSTMPSDQIVDISTEEEEARLKAFLEAERRDLARIEAQIEEVLEKAGAEALEKHLDALKAKERARREKRAERMYLRSMKGDSVSRSLKKLGASPRKPIPRPEKSKVQRFAEFAEEWRQRNSSTFNSPSKPATSFDALITSSSQLATSSEMDDKQFTEHVRGVHKRVCDPEEEAKKAEMEDNLRFTFPDMSQEMIDEICTDSRKRSDVSRAATAGLDSDFADYLLNFVECPEARLQDQLKELELESSIKDKPTRDASVRLPKKKSKKHYAKISDMLNGIDSGSKLYEYQVLKLQESLVPTTSSDYSSDQSATLNKPESSK